MGELLDEHSCFHDVTPQKLLIKIWSYHNSSDDDLAYILSAHALI